MKKTSRKNGYGMVALGVVLVCLATLFIYFGVTKPALPQAYFADTNVLCLPEGNRDLDIAWTAELSIYVEGVPEAVPINIGNTTRCTAELHTKQGNGTVYVRLYDKARLNVLSFADFFTVWGIDTYREGYSLSMMVNGVTVSDLSAVSLKDGMKVSLYYILLPVADDVVEEGTDAQ